MVGEGHAFQSPSDVSLDDHMFLKHIVSVFVLVFQSPSDVSLDDHRGEDVSSRPAIQVSIALRRIS